MKDGGMAKLCRMDRDKTLGGGSMWYVIQVRTGMEEMIRNQCVHIIDQKILEQCFVPYYEEQKKYQGTWHTEKKVLFPRYVFIVSSQLEDLYKNLWKVIGMTKLLGTGDEIVPLFPLSGRVLPGSGVGHRTVSFCTDSLVQRESDQGRQTGRAHMDYRQHRD